MDGRQTQKVDDWTTHKLSYAEVVARKCIQSQQLSKKQREAGRAPKVARSDSGRRPTSTQTPNAASLTQCHSDSPSQQKRPTSERQVTINATSQGRSQTGVGLTSGSSHSAVSLVHCTQMQQRQQTSQKTQTPVSPAPQVQPSHAGPTSGLSSKSEVHTSQLQPWQRQQTSQTTINPAQHSHALESNAVSLVPTDKPRPQAHSQLFNVAC